ncbi:hypothetical protein IV494_05730 [Kaistella sp. G5-32]|uniref:SnoaL-like domain-containing protein n=1 Tax=Kaistella gelatinilytica TaxID=2787636 RepID=A0ABS0FAE6_9FLAO|nr:hypothetical protein [Kaistella gelatinilytica]MBF8456678.1 hypothetical protein [Kaistella gelatinilytica]
MDCKVTSFMEDLNSLKVENLQKWFNEESKIWIPPAKEIQGGGRILAMFRAIFRKYESINWCESEIFDLGKGKYFYETISIGNLRGKGIYTNNICTVISFTDCGKIKSLSDYFKDTSAFS